MDKKILLNYFYNILYQIVKIAMPIIIVPYTMGHLGAEALGISDFAANIASWFILFGTLGVNLYGNREIARVREDDNKRSKTFFEILCIQLINMSIAIVFYMFYIRFAVYNNTVIYLLHTLTIITSAVDVTWYFYGIEDFKSVSIRNIVIKVIGVALIMLLVKSPDDLWLYVVINSGTDLLGQIAMITKLRQSISFQRINVIDAYKKHLKATIVLFIPTIAISVYTILDQTMIGFLTVDKSNVALYKTAQSFVKMFLYFITSIGAVVLPRMSNLLSNSKNSEEINKFINTTFSIALALSLPMMIAMITVSPFFIPWYLPNQLEIIALIQFSSPIIVLISLSNVFGTQFLVPAMRNKEYTNSVIYGAITNFIVNLILIPSFGGLGAAVGSVAAEFAVTIVQWTYVRKDLRIDALSSFIKYTLASIVMGVLVVLIGTKLGASLFTNLIQAVVGFLSYLIMLFVLKEEVALTLLRKITNR